MSMKSPSSNLSTHFHRHSVAREVTIVCISKDCVRETFSLTYRSVGLLQVGTNFCPSTGKDASGAVQICRTAWTHVVLFYEREVIRCNGLCYYMGVQNPCRFNAELRLFTSGGPLELVSRKRQVRFVAFSALLTTTILPDTRVFTQLF